MAVETQAPLSEVSRYLALAAGSPSPAAERYRLMAGRAAIRDRDLDTASDILRNLGDISLLPQTLQIETRLLQASLAVAHDNAERTMEILDTAPLSDTDSLNDSQRIEVTNLRGQAYAAMGQYLAGAREHTRMTPQLSGQQLADNNNHIWQILSAAPPTSLAAQRSMIDSYELRGWVELANLINNSQDNLERQVQVIRTWQERWNLHSASQKLPDALDFVIRTVNERPSRIALILPLGNAAGQAVNEGFIAAYYDALHQEQPVPEVLVLDSTQVSDILPLYRRAAASDVDLIIGPLMNESVRQLQQLPELPVPTLALNYGDEDVETPEGLYQFGLAPEDEITQAALLAWQAGHRNAALLTPAGAEYRRIQDTFINYWEALGGHIVANSTFGNSSSYSDVIRQMMHVDSSEARANNLRSLLPGSNILYTPRPRQDVDFIFLLANPVEGREIKPTLAYHFSGNIPVYAMPAIYDGGNNTAANRELNDVIFVDAPWILTQSDPLKATMKSVWPDASGPVQRLRAMGVDAFRLHVRVSHLANFPGVRVQGATGILSMREDGSITRELIGAQFVDGKAQPVAAAPEEAGLVLNET